MEVSAESAKEEGHHWLFPRCTILQSEQVNNSIAVIGERMYTYTHTHTHTCRHRCLNMFLQTYCTQWLLTSEQSTHDKLTEELLDKQDFLVLKRQEETKRMAQTDQKTLRKTSSLDPLTQLLNMFKRIATSREW